MIDRWGISSENAPRGASLDLTDDKSTLVQVMAWYYKNIPLDPRNIYMQNNYVYMQDSYVYIIT